VTEEAGGRVPSASCVSTRLAFVPLLLLLSACHPRPATLTALPPAPSPRLVALADRIDRALADPALARGTWGLAVRSLDRHDSLYELNARKLLMPASTLKIVTLAAAAERLGWDYTYTTTLSYVGRIEAGVLWGDLYVQGSGDPTIDDWDGKATALFADWVGRLKTAGVQTIAGRILGDDNVFDDNGLGTGWMWDDLSASYSAPVGGLQFNQNSAQVSVEGPVTTKGAPIVRLTPTSAPLTVDSRLSWTPDPAPRIEMRYSGDSIELDGVVPFGTQWVRNVAVRNPTIYFLHAFRAALAASGIEVQGVQDFDDQSLRIAVSTVPMTQGSPIVRVAEHRSPPLSSIAETMARLSQNLFAETLLKTIGVKRGDDGRLLEPGTAAAGLTVETELMTAWGVPAGEISAVDGSGLSRYNVATANALAAVLEHVYADERLRGPFVEALPLAGTTGTLERRMVGTPAAGNVRAKTGSFSNARAVAGFVRTADGEPLVFAIIANNFGVAPSLIDAATDDILVALSEFTRR